MQLSNSIWILENWSLWKTIVWLNQILINKKKEAVEKIVWSAWIMNVIRLIEDWKDPIRLYRWINSNIIEENIQRLSQQELELIFWKIKNVKRHSRWPLDDSLEYIESLIKSIHWI